jgi:hypothetical protein
MARRLRNVGACPPAVPLYRRAIEVTTSDQLRAGIRAVLIDCLLTENDFAGAKSEARRGQEALIMASEFKQLERTADSLATAAGKTP